mmetsp:Transcript_19041/g.53302  ORF Transcript_19041/g.53302 Transcript_19041/m.53302 type:complete len:238 (+) Transcript_19041:77-790(+)
MEKRPRSLHLIRQHCQASSSVSQLGAPEVGGRDLGQGPRSGRHRWRRRQRQSRDIAAGAAVAQAPRLVVAPDDHAATEEEAEGYGAADHRDGEDQKVLLGHGHPDTSEQSEAATNGGTHLRAQRDAVDACPSPRVRDPLVGRAPTSPLALLSGVALVVDALGLVHRGRVLREVHAVVALRGRGGGRRRGRRGGEAAGGRRLLARGGRAERSAAGGRGLRASLGRRRGLLLEGGPMHR